VSWGKYFAATLQPPVLKGVRDQKKSAPLGGAGGQTEFGMTG
jgi:hypothetical protein